ncbi:hypothetical protein EVAR_46508_1 [Eumeta japonica]|uniref:Uncharacterized protein n=1 Tax=Eumeta variegata TaxID=151549 RepID=A0A4C1WU46_EUMVA|nr:hypothetical protein EVAR_46508_1 [Eumeta japonica]
MPHMPPTPRFGGPSLSATSSIEIFDFFIFERQTRRAQQYFKLSHHFLLYKAQVGPHVDYCCHLWAVSSQYQLLPLDRIERRIARIVSNLLHQASRTLWLCREM